MALTDLHASSTVNGAKATSPARRSIRKSKPASKKKKSTRTPRYQRLASQGLETSKQIYKFMTEKAYPFARTQFKNVADYLGVTERGLVYIILGVITFIAILGIAFIYYLFVNGYFPTYDQLVDAAVYVQGLPDKVPKNLLPKAGGMISGAFSWVCEVVGVSERTMLYFLGAIAAIVVASIPFVVFFIIALLAWLEVLSYETCSRIGLGDFFVRNGIISIYDDEDDE